VSEQNIVTRLRITHFLDGRELGMTAQRAEAADEIERLRRELDAANSRAICELADDDDEAEHECGWVVCGVCWNNAALAHKKVADVLRQDINRLHTECGHREADCGELRAECERLQADLGHGRDERVKLRDELEAARKFIGELTAQVQQCEHYDDELAAARAECERLIQHVDFHVREENRYRQLYEMRGETIDKMSRAAGGWDGTG